MDRHQRARRSPTPTNSSPTSRRGRSAGRSRPRRASSTWPALRIRLKAGDSFEVACSWALRAALCSPDSLARRARRAAPTATRWRVALAYFLWNSMPDDALAAKAAAGDCMARRAEGGGGADARRPKAQRFTDDFLGQWLKLRLIAANDPDSQALPRVQQVPPRLDDDGIGRVLPRAAGEGLAAPITWCAPTSRMLNGRLAVHYGLPGVSGSQVRRVAAAGGEPARRVPHAGRR